MTIFLHRTSITFIWYVKYHSTANNAVVSKNAIFRKLGLKFLKNYFLKISLYFLVEDAKPFHLICKLLFYYEEYFRIVVKILIFGLKVWNTKICIYHISMQRRLSPSTSNANHYFTINNKEWVSKMSFFQNVI